MLEETNKILEDIFNVEYYQRVQNLKENDLKLTHYTSASVALSIIDKKEIWLNNVGNMNDYSEIGIGIGLLAKTFNELDAGLALKNIIKAIDPVIGEDLVYNYNKVHNNLYRTYVFCLTEEKAGDKYGRLSMWRAYAPKNGVALILNTDPFIKESSRTRAFTIPMFYYDIDEFAEKFKVLTDNLKLHMNELQIIDKFEILKFLHNKFLVTVLSLKHKGFEEEKEWRILYNDKIYPSDGVVEERIEIIKGMPRIIKVINFEKLNEFGYSTKLNDILYKIIIGPSDNPIQLQEIFIKKLTENGVVDAEKKVVISEIPIRI